MGRISRILILAAGFAAAFGCADNPALRLRFQAEKKLFDAEKIIAQAQVNPREAPPELVRRAGEKLSAAAEFALAALDSVSEQANPVEYRELQQIAFQAGNELNRLLYNQRRYEESIAVLTRLLSQSALAREELMVTQVNLGRTLQASGRWDSALAMYTSALETFFPPVDSRGEIVKPLFDLPAHIFAVARQVGDSVEAAYHLERAVSYYTDLAAKTSDRLLQASCRAALAGLYRETGQGQKEIAQLEQLSDTASQAYPAVRARIAEIVGFQFRDFTRAAAMLAEEQIRLGPSDTAYYPDLLFRKALIRMEQKRYGDARQILVALKRDHPRYWAMTPPAQLAMARTFELEDNWDRAEVEYHALIEGYRGSDEAMGAFLYVARRYEQLGRKDQADRWYRDAREYYAQVARYSQEGLMEARALSFQAELDSRLGNWAEAAGTLEDLYRKYGRHEIGRQALVRAAAIRRERLGQQQVADSLLTALKAGLTEIEPTSEL